MLKMHKMCFDRCLRVSLSHTYVRTAAAGLRQWTDGGVPGFDDSTFSATRPTMKATGQHSMIASAFLALCLLSHEAAAFIGGASSANVLLLRQPSTPASPGTTATIMERYVS